jgi:hypothetical protein
MREDLTPTAQESPEVTRLTLILFEDLIIQPLRPFAAHEECNRLGDVGPPLRNYNDVFNGLLRVGLDEALRNLATDLIGSLPGAGLGRPPELPPAIGPPQML